MSWRRRLQERMRRDRAWNSSPRWRGSSHLQSRTVSGGRGQGEEKYHQTHAWNEQKCSNSRGLRASGGTGGSDSVRHAIRRVARSTHSLSRYLAILGPSTYWNTCCFALAKSLREMTGVWGRSPTWSGDSKGRNGGTRTVKGRDLLGKGRPRGLNLVKVM